MWLETDCPAYVAFSYIYPCRKQSELPDKYDRRMAKLPINQRFTA